MDVAAHGGDLAVGTSHPLFGETVIPPDAVGDYSPALKRFLVAFPVGERTPGSITLVTSWAAALKRE